MGGQIANGQKLTEGYVNRAVGDFGMTWREELPDDVGTRKVTPYSGVDGEAFVRVWGERLGEYSGPETHGLWVGWQEWTTKIDSTDTTEDSNADLFAQYRIRLFNELYEPHKNEPQKVQWLWWGRFALGSISVIAGFPGTGKSFLTCYMASRVSQGLDWPDGRRCVRGSVVMLSSEDAASAVMHPRLQAADADLSRVKIYESCDITFPRDIGFLEAAIVQANESGPCKLITIDPWGASIGVDGHKEVEVRGILKQITSLAKKYNLAVVIVAHLNKGEKGKTEVAMHRIGGSQALPAAARMVSVLGRDEEDPQGRTRLLLPAKNNYGVDTHGLAFQILQPEHGHRQPALGWSDTPINRTADDLFQTKPRGPRPEKKNDAVEFLEELLSDGPVPATQVFDEAEAAGFAKRTIERAKSEAGVISRKLPAFDSKWCWSLASKEAE